MANVLTYQEAAEIYETMKGKLNSNDEDIVDLYERMIGNAVRYAHIRAGWHALSKEKKREKDDSRTFAHDAFISSLDIIARTEGETGTQWRERLTDDRKRIGDFACYIALFYGLKAR